jgi:hypothetical protein
MSRLKRPQLKRPALKRPAIKTPQLHAPQVLSDLFQDLRDRHLLPLVAVLAMAIVAVPFVLGGSDSEPTSGSGTSTAPAAGASASDGASKLVVVAANPGLRDYRLRLRALEAKNPFRQHFTAPQLSGSDLGGGATTTVPTESTNGGVAFPEPSVPSFPGGTSGSGGGGGTGGGGKTKVKVETEYVQYTVDVKVVRRAQGANTRQPHERILEDVPELTMLPGKKAPVAVFMGVSADREKALLLVSENVTSIFGDVRCMAGSESCQLIMVEPGFPVTFVYGERNRAYRLNVLRIEETVRDHP